ncbi:MAG: exodeoxyribonuclease I [Pseudomonadales bacterium]|nr:exodeoxyribonuclease I [Pseudomonadales bacterium]
MASASIYWYDFETFGNDPRRDRASQFAGIRTDENLNVIGDPLVIYCQPANDFLPNPMACLITGITPQHAAEKGMNEAEFTKAILAEFSQPGTCVAGYNSIRFDDEVTRQLLYRNFFDPYEREWKNGNSRWDIIDMVRLCAATRPEGIRWPKKEDGSNSFRLEELTKANDIEHAAAHDALSDVLATIEFARLIKQQQPRLYDYVFGLRSKQKVQAEIDLNTRKPVLHVSVMYPSSRGCLALTMPICPHPENSNGVIVYDLRVDPDTWADLSEAEIRERIYTPKDQLPEGVERIPLKTIHYNRCPVVTSAAVLAPEKAQQFEIDLDGCRANWEKLQSTPSLYKKIQKVFRNETREQESDPDYMIYSGGFFSDHDKGLMQMIRATSPHDLGRLDLPFRDSRLNEMLFRYRARNFLHTLNAAEEERWQEFRQVRLHDEHALARYESDLQLARATANADQAAVLDQLEIYVASIQQT